MTLANTFPVVTRKPTLVCRAIAVAAVSTLAVAAVLLSGLRAPAYAGTPAYGQNITRAEVIARAHHWLRENVPYSQSAYHPDRQGRKYRTDCSGFISMAWRLDRSRTTATLDDVSTVIRKASLKPGDILLRRDSSVQHVVLFERWTNSAMTRADIIAQANSVDDMEHYRNAAISSWSSYTAYRYNKIVDDPLDGPGEATPMATGRCGPVRPDHPMVGSTDRHDRYDVAALGCVIRAYVATTVCRHHSTTDTPARRYRRQHRPGHDTP